MQPIVDRQNIHLRIPSALPFLPLVLNFVREGVAAFGYGSSEIDALTLAAEEICSYLMKLQQPSHAIELSLTDGTWRLVLGIDCRATDVDLRAFNLTWRVSDDEASLEHMGLLLASRMVDRMTLSSRKDRMQLRLIKHRSYSRIDEAAPDPLPHPDRYELIAAPSPDVFRYALVQLQAYRVDNLPPFFLLPSLAADMLVSGDLEATMACDPGGSVLGLACRRWMSPRCVELLGPYVLIEGPLAESIRTDLVEDGLSRTARTQAVGMICRHVQQSFTHRLFDTLGALPETNGEGKTVERPVYYRLLREEDGATVYIDPVLKPFLESAYERLTLPRILRQLPPSGAHRFAHTVLSAEIDREGSRCTLRLLQAGPDCFETVRDHIRMVQQEGIRNIVFEMDLGNASENAQASVLVAAGFQPQLLIPDGGQGDLLLFTVAGGEGE